MTSFGLSKFGGKNYFPKFSTDSSLLLVNRPIGPWLSTHDEATKVLWHRERRTFFQRFFALPGFPVPFACINFFIGEKISNLRNHQLTHRSKILRF